MNQALIVLLIFPEVLKKDLVSYRLHIYTSDLEQFKMYSIETNVQLIEQKFIVDFWYSQ